MTTVLEKNHRVWVSLRALEDTNLSIEAVGWLAWMTLRMGSTGAFTMEDVYERSTKGRDGTRVRIKELEDAGYLYRERGANTADGTFVWDCELFDSPDDNPHFKPEG